MTKQKIVKQIVDQELWKIFQKNYPMAQYHKSPQSETQIKFFEDVSKFIYDVFGVKIHKNELKKMKKEILSEN